MVWVGTDKGLEKYDPATNSFTHFRHNNKDPNSISYDTIFSLLVDKTGDLWIDH